MQHTAYYKGSEVTVVSVLRQSPSTCSGLLVATVFDREVNCRKAASVSVASCWESECGQV